MSKFEDLLNSLLEEGIYSYSCLMLDVDNSVVEPILELIEDDDLSGEGKESNTHTTIKYGLHISDSEEIFDFVDIKPFFLVLNNISLFENDDFDVLKLGVESKELINLNKDICKEFEYTDSYPDYNPHVTIAYLKGGKGRKYVDMINDKFPDFERKVKVDKLIFSKPNGDVDTKNLK